MGILSALKGFFSFFILIILAGKLGDVYKLDYVSPFKGEKFVTPNFQLYCFVPAGFFIIEPLASLSVSWLFIFILLRAVLYVYSMISLCCSGYSAFISVVESRNFYSSV